MTIIATHLETVFLYFRRDFAERSAYGSYFARWGGEEFLIFLPETKLADALTIADRLCKKITAIQLTTGSNKSLSFTESVGIAHTYNTNVSLDELICQADQQLYCAKELVTVCTQISLAK